MVVPVSRSEEGRHCIGPPPQPTWHSSVRSKSMMMWLKVSLRLMLLAVGLTSTSSCILSDLVLIVQWAHMHHFLSVWNAPIEKKHHYTLRSIGAIAVGLITMSSCIFTVLMLFKLLWTLSVINASGPVVSSWMVGARDGISDDFYW